MHPEYSPAIQRALDAAQLCARRQRAENVQRFHLMQGLVSDVGGRAAALLKEAGADLAKTMVLWTEASPLGPEDQLPSPLPLDESARASLDRAARIAREFSTDPTLTSDHLLLALLRDGADLRRQLEEIGFSFTRLEEKLLAFLAPPLRLEEPLELAELTERIDVTRILDANINRAREALRVIEDYCRFVLNDSFLSREFKQIRHGLRQTLLEVQASHLLQSRETLGDVGTQISVPSERERHSLKGVVQANIKRLQEALRSLEEFFKLSNPDAALSLEKLRYRSYTLEKVLLLGVNARQRLSDTRLYVLLTGALCNTSLDYTIREAAAGGADIFQLREKQWGDRVLIERAREVRRWTKEAGVLFIVNDRPDIARLVDADGVHLGQEDMPVQEARRVLGPDLLIGVSTHTMAQVRQAILDGANYLGIGPTFPSATKAFVEYPGLNFVSRVSSETSLPTFAIGGITRDTVEKVVAAGARRVAVSHAVCGTDDPCQAAAALRRCLER